MNREEKLLDGVSEKIFGGTKMTWTRVVAMSIILGIVVGMFMSTSILKHTSFQQPGISFEFWILAAMFIILNCEKPVEAGLKTFVFFLISQPIIYLVQVPFVGMGWQIFSYYPRWAIITVLTLPGGMIAWLTKRDNVLGAIILSAANLILCYELPEFVNTLVKSFPHMILAILFILWEMIFFIKLLCKKKNTRLIAVILAAVMLIGSFVLFFADVKSRSGVYETQLAGNRPFELVGDYNGVEVEIDGSTLRVKMDYFGTIPIDLKDSDGKVFTVELNCSGDGVNWTFL